MPDPDFHARKAARIAVRLTPKPADPPPPPGQAAKEQAAGLIADLGSGAGWLGVLALVCVLGPIILAVVYALHVAVVNLLLS